MKLITTKHCITILSLTFVILLSSSTLKAQYTQTRSVVNTQQNQPQISEENRKAMQEIEMMRQMIKDRREQQDEQKRVLQSLQQAIGNVSGESTDNNNYTPHLNSSSESEYYEDEYLPVQQSTHAPAQATSGSTLSRIETQKRQEYQDLEKQYEFDMDRAQREIAILTKQLNIANTQLEKCEGRTVATNDQALFYSEPQPVQQIQKKVKSKKGIQAVAPHQRIQAKVAPNTLSENQVEPQMTEESKRIMQDIEMMRQMIKDRRTEQEQQKRVIQALQNQLH